ncbi:hypothetical protein EYF80_025815 [Liparis tanakae]|uniref:Uncharacterized protein n=1 Tax=Liparis tanakae TaxID=230148 RepID=A0A4Z2HG83_9TELE|nr:hypothetical protein EYF80_025815 [Liparis tanakae]
MRAVGIKLVQAGWASACTPPRGPTCYQLHFDDTSRGRVTQECWTGIWRWRCRVSEIVIAKADRVFVLPLCETSGCASEEKSLKEKTRHIMQLCVCRWNIERSGLRRYSLPPPVCFCFSCTQRGRLVSVKPKEKTPFMGNVTSRCPKLCHPSSQNFSQLINNDDVHNSKPLQAPDDVKKQHKESFMLSGYNFIFRAAAEDMHQVTRSMSHSFDPSPQQWRPTLSCSCH